MRDDAGQQIVALSRRHAGEKGGRDRGPARERRGVVANPAAQVVVAEAPDEQVVPCTAVEGVGGGVDRVTTVTVCEPAPIGSARRRSAASAGADRCIEIFIGDFPAAA